MDATFFSRFLVCMAISFILLPTKIGLAQTPAEVRAAFKNLHDDHVKNNCEEAESWLFIHRETLKDAMLTEVYQTDWQGRAAIVNILLATPGFVPDERFLQAFVLPRLAKESSDSGAFPVGDIAWKFIDAQYDKYESQLVAMVTRPESGPRNIWIATWFFKKHGTLAKHMDLYTQDVLDRAASGLKNDKIAFNASQAIRTFLLLGNVAKPTLQKAAQSGDVQAGSLARATLNAMNGDHDAFGYLQSKIDINRDPLGSSAPEPGWLSDAVLANLDRTHYP